MLWFDTADIMHYPPFVDKTLKLFNLKQVAHEIETSVMSKVSCTACKAGLFSYCISNIKVYKKNLLCYAIIKIQIACVVSSNASIHLRVLMM